MPGRSARPTGDGGDEGEFVAVLEGGVGLGVGAVEGEGDVVELVGESGEAVAELFDGVGDGGFLGEVEADFGEASAVTEVGEKADGDTHEMRGGASPTLQRRGGGGVLVAVVADDGDFVAVGQFHDFTALEDDGFAGFEDEAACAGGVHFFDGLHADGGDVEAHVGVFVGDLDEGPAADFAELAGPLDHGVGAFEGFDGDDILVKDGDGLADIHAADGLADGPAGMDVAPLGFAGLAAGHDAGDGEVFSAIGG